VPQRVIDIMPELPEVEYTARQLRAAIVGITIRDVSVFWERTVRRPKVPDFIAGVVGKRIEGVRRRGKLLLLDLSSECFLSIHRRMTGNFLLTPPGWAIDTHLSDQDRECWDTRGPAFYSGTTQEQVVSSEARYCRVCFLLEDGRYLLFTDPRKFGRIGLWSRSQEQEAFVGLGPEPLSETFTSEYLCAALARKRASIKQVLLDQSVVVGLGNIYADEALFAARIHPLRRGNSLTVLEVEALYRGIVSVLTQGIEHGGTSFSDYHDLWGQAGDHYQHVCVYRQEGRPCRCCGSIVERIVVAQRSSHYCPTCQRL
jgi:formamidopyrimidine-DNA glycosylase